MKRCFIRSLFGSEQGCCLPDRDAVATRLMQAGDWVRTTAIKADDVINYSVERARDFGVLEFAMLKVCLLSFGLWVGSLFASFFKRFRWVLFIGFMVSSLYLIWHLFFRNED